MGSGKRAAAAGVALVVFLQAAAALASLPAVAATYTDLDVAASPTPFVLADPSAHLSGNVTVRTGATLILQGTNLYMESNGHTITLEAGATLILAANAAIRDSTSDTDDGSAADWTYSIVAGPGATLRLEAGAGILGSGGITANGATIDFGMATYSGNRGAVVLNGASSFHAVNSTFSQDAPPVIDARGTSVARVEGLAMPTYMVGPSATFAFSTFAAVTVRDIMGKALGGADWSFETNAGVLAGSVALGGMLTTTVLDHEGFPAPAYAAVPFLTDMGGSKTFAGVVAHVRYGDWSDARVLNTAADQRVDFTARNRGFALHDDTEMAMLENMGMHDMMMGNDTTGMNHSMPMGPVPMPMANMSGPMMTQGPGSAWGDFNGDGNLDVILTGAPETDSMTLMMMHMMPGDYPAPALFLGDGHGMFMEEMMTGLEGATGATGVSAGDFNGDGNLDLFVARYGETGMVEENMTTMQMMFTDGMPLKAMLFEGDGHGMFMDVTTMAGITMPPSYTVGGVWGDYNRDGCLDLFVVNMGQMVMPMDMSGNMTMMGMDMAFVKPVPDVLYKNNCDGTFTDVTSAAGDPDGGGKGITSFEGMLMDPQMMYWYANGTQKAASGSGIGYTAAWIDFNEDGFPDLLVANDFGVSPLYKNNGNGTFTLWTQQAGLDKVGSAMGFAVADFNRDGHLDIFQSNFNEDYLWMANGDGTFTDRAAEWGVADMSVGWGVAAPDLNNDGYPDLAIATGYMSMHMKASELSVLYKNDGGHRFWDVSAPSGFADPALGISVAAPDVNRDGRPDLFLGNTNASNRLFLNAEGLGGFVRLDLHGLVSNSYGVGAEVTALIDGKPFRAAVQPGGDYASSSEPGLIIGLGTAKFAQRVTVYWPSGIVQTLGDVAAGTSRVVTEEAGLRVDAGPDGATNTSKAVMLSGALDPAAGGPVALHDASYSWIFHGPTADTTVAGKDVMFAPQVPGVYAAEFVVADRFGDPYGSDFCIMRVADTTAPNISVSVPKTILASGKATFDAGNTTDNDPAFATGAKYDWSFKIGAMEVTATGVKPTVQLPKPGLWNVTLKVTDPSGNSIARSYDARVSGTAPATVTQDMVLLSIAATTLSLIGIAAISSRIWRRQDESLVPEHFGELRPQEILLPGAASDAPPFPFRPDDKEEE